MNVARAIADARTAGVGRLDAELMLARLLARTRAAIIAHDDAPLDAETTARWHDWLGRRAAGEPIAYLLGEKEFFGLVLEVDRCVLVPRPDTELLVHWALERIAQRPCDEAPARVVDLGTGSGAIAVAIASAAADAAVVTATDCSREALDVARRNAARCGVKVSYLQADWWQAIGDRGFDVAVSNPPYVRDGDGALPALRHEPRLALVAGEDGLAACREIVAGALEHLDPGGWLLLEHGFDQAAEVRGLLAGSGFDEIETRRDLAGHERATGGRRPAS